MDVRLIGVKEIQDVLKLFPQQFNHKVMQAANAESAKILVAKEHLLAPVGRTGKLADSIGVIKPPFSRSGSVGEVHVGPRRGRFGGHAAHLVEFGTKERRTKKRHPVFGYERGKMTAEPFVQPAFEQTQGQVIASITANLERKTLEFLKRILKRG